jgi:hypothetical protein
VSSSQPRVPDTTRYDGKQHQQQIALQPTEEYFQDEQIEEEGCVSGVVSISSKSQGHTLSSMTANVSSLQCEDCQREFQSPGLLK